MDKKCTDVWELYEKGKAYNNSLDPNQYTLVDTNIEFFIGNQWKGLSNSQAMATLPKPVFNIIKRVLSMFVASLTSTSCAISFEPLANKAEETPLGDVSDGMEIQEDANAVRAADMATSEIANILEKEKFDYKIREALFDGGQTGDYCMHCYWDSNAKPYGGTYGAYRGEIKIELVDGINVMFGNPNTRIVENQPYILVIGRDMVTNLREEYKAHHSDGDDYVILSDTTNEYQAGSGGKVELSASDKTGKALYIYKYFKKSKEVKLYNEDGTPKMEQDLDEKGQPIPVKKKGIIQIDGEGNPLYKEHQATEVVTTVWVTKCTQNAEIFEPIDTGLTYYPIAWGNWATQKNQYHGRALVTEIIPNQIYINTMFALVMRHQQMLGFPKTLYDANVIGQWSNAVGQAIAVYDLPPDKRMSDLHSVIQPADMSTQIMNCIDRAIALTKECLGATDAQLGNVRPDNTSALIALQSSSQVPLENPQSLKYEFVEDLGRILLDMMGTYYGTRPVVKTVEQQKTIYDPQTNQPSQTTVRTKVIEMFDFSRLKDLWLNVRADVGASTYWSKIAVVQTLDNLKQNGMLDVIDYLERLPDEYIPRKQELLAKLRSQLQQPTAPMAPPQGGEGAPMGMPTGVAEANYQPNTGALVGTMPQQMQANFEDQTGRVQKNLLRQAQLTTPGI